MNSICIHNHFHIFTWLCIYLHYVYILTWLTWQAQIGTCRPVSWLKVGLFMSISIIILHTSATRIHSCSQQQDSMVWVQQSNIQCGCLDSTKSREIAAFHCCFWSKMNRHFISMKSSLRLSPKGDQRSCPSHQYLWRLGHFLGYVNVWVYYDCSSKAEAWIFYSRIDQDRQMVWEAACGRRLTRIHCWRWKQYLRLILSAGMNWSRLQSRRSIGGLHSYCCWSCWSMLSSCWGKRWSTTVSRWMRHYSTIYKQSTLLPGLLDLNRPLLKDTSSVAQLGCVMLS